MVIDRLLMVKVEIFFLFDDRLVVNINVYKNNYSDCASNGCLGIC